MTEVNSFEPDWISPPGETIGDVLEERGWTQAELAARTGFTRKHVNDLVKGRAAITPDSALRLEAVLGSTAEFWLRREANYREAVERKRRHAALRSESGWLQELPIAHMTKYKWIKRFRDQGAQVAECLKFFGVASVAVWRNRHNIERVAWRTSTRLATKDGAIAAWLRQAELEAQEVNCADYDKNQFSKALSELRGLTNEPSPEVFVPRLISQCATCGVAVAFVPAPRGCPASGATRWLTPSRAQIILSLRYKTDDHLWFTFFHEAAHILLHGRKNQFFELDADDREHVESVDHEAEAQADRFARELLISPGQAALLQALGETDRVSRESVVRLATRLGIAPGIVVGRMQKEGWLPWRNLNGLKVRYAWSADGQRTQRPRA